MGFPLMSPIFTFDNVKAVETLPWNGAGTIALNTNDAIAIGDVMFAGAEPSACAKVRSCHV